MGMAVLIGGLLDACGGYLNPDSMGKGGSPPAAGTTGTAGAAGRGGAGRGGSPAAAGTGGSATASDAFHEPACMSTVARNNECAPADQQFCYKTCGPEKTGRKSETCVNGLYQEMSGCAFDPNQDYSCYAIPTTANAACPQGVTPQASMPCEVDHCVQCNNLGGLAGGQFLDSAGATKPGYCTCQRPNAAGQRTWSCANDTAWPCPLGRGCNVDAGTSLPPVCAPTVVKGAACGPTDQPFCYRFCAPGESGVDPLFCMNGVYSEMASCALPPNNNYSCYKIPVSANAACPMSVPTYGAGCDVPDCTPCNSLRGIAGGQYVDSAGATNVGFCVCQPAPSGGSAWNCARDTAWPCPALGGC